jgi:anti-sigma factor RsiW
MNCPLENPGKAQLLLDYCSGRLEPDAATVLDRHLALCRACAEFTRRQQAVWQALDTWEAPPPSPDFDARLYRRIDAHASLWDVFLRPFRTGTLWRHLPAAAVICLLVMAGTVLVGPTAPPEPAANDTAQVDSVQAEQVEQALDAMEMLNEFSSHVRTDVPDSKL